MVGHCTARLAALLCLAAGCTSARPLGATSAPCLGHWTAVLRSGTARLAPGSARCCPRPVSRAWRRERGSGQRRSERPRHGLPGPAGVLAGDSWRRAGTPALPTTTKHMRRHAHWACCSGRCRPARVLQGGHALSDTAQLVLASAPGSDDLTLALSFPLCAGEGCPEAAELRTPALTVETVLTAAAQVGCPLLPRSAAGAPSQGSHPQGLASVRASTVSDANVVLQGSLVPGCLHASAVPPPQAFASVWAGLQRLLARLPDPWQGAPRPSCMASRQPCPQPACSGAVPGATAVGLQTDGRLACSGSSQRTASARVGPVRRPSTGCDMLPPSSVPCHRRLWPTPSPPAARGCRCPGPDSLAAGAEVLAQG